MNTKEIREAAEKLQAAMDAFCEDPSPQNITELEQAEIRLDELILDKPATVLALCDAADEREDLLLLLKRAASKLHASDRLRVDIVGYFQRHGIPAVSLREMPPNTPETPND